MGAGLLAEGMASYVEYANIPNYTWNRKPLQLGSGHLARTYMLHTFS